jgi:hypothetical protein
MTFNNPYNSQYQSSKVTGGINVNGNENIVGSNITNSFNTLEAGTIQEYIIEYSQDRQLVFGVKVVEAFLTKLREEKVIIVTGNFDIDSINQLAEEVCWSLFEQVRPKTIPMTPPPQPSVSTPNVINLSPPTSFTSIASPYRTHLTSLGS